MSTHTRRLDVYSLGAVKIVAVENWFDDKLFDWAAYIGPTDWGSERIANEGFKLLAKEAKAFFTQLSLTIEAYRH